MSKATAALAVVLLGLIASVAEAHVHDCMQGIDERIAREYSEYCEVGKVDLDKFPGSVEERVLVVAMCACKIARIPTSLWHTMMTDALLLTEFFGERRVASQKGYEGVDDGALAIKLYQWVTTSDDDRLNVGDIESVLVHAKNAVYVGYSKNGTPLKSFQATVKNDCKLLQEQFLPFYQKIEWLQKLSKNPSAGLRLALAESDRGLFKVIFTYHLCRLALKTGNIDEKFYENQ